MRSLMACYRYLKQRVDEVRSKKDKKELEKARLKRHIAMSEHEMSKKPIDPLLRSKMTLQVCRPTAAAVSLT